MDPRSLFGDHFSSHRWAYKSSCRAYSSTFPQESTKCFETFTEPELRYTCIRSEFNNLSGELFFRRNIGLDLFCPSDYQVGFRACFRETSITGESSYHFATQIQIKILIFEEIPTFARTFSSFFKTWFVFLYYRALGESVVLFLEKTKRDFAFFSFGP